MLIKKVYSLTNIVMLAIASVWLLKHLHIFIKMLHLINLKSICYILIAIALFILMHLLKASRLYIILLESNIPSYELLNQYFKTTFITLLTPFKIGDIFRVICFSKLTKSLKTGLSSILIDRFFDTVVLLTFLMIYQLIDESSNLVITVVILSFSLILCFIYMVIRITYPYLNHFIIAHSTSKKSITLLDYLEQIKIIQQSITHMIKNRVALILFLSILAWCIELIILNLIMLSFSQSYDILNLGKYLEDSFLGRLIPINIFYFGIGSLVLLLLASFTYLKSMKEGRPHV